MIHAILTTMSSLGALFLLGRCLAEVYAKRRPVDWARALRRLRGE